MGRKTHTTTNVTIIIILIILFSFFIFLNTKQGAEESPDKIIIGAILPLSGGLSFVGTQMQKGVLLATSEYQEDELEVVFEDDQTYNDIVSIKTLNKLVNINNIDALLNVSVNTIKSLDSTLKNADIPRIVLWDNDTTIQNLKGNVYGFGYSTEETGKKMARYAHNSLKTQSVAVITAQDEWSEIISGAFIDQFQELGGTISVHERVSVDENDFRSVLLHAKERESDAIYFPLFPEPTIKLVKQARELGFETLLTGDGLINISLDTEGVYSTQTWVNNPVFMQKYKNFFNEEVDPVGLAFSGLGYDAVHFIMNTRTYIQNQGKSVTPENLVDALSRTPYSGVTGSVEFNTQNTSEKTQSITVVNSGKLELKEE